MYHLRGNTFRTEIASLELLRSTKIRRMRLGKYGSTGGECHRRTSQTAVLIDINSGNETTRTTDKQRRMSRSEYPAFTTQAGEILDRHSQDSKATKANLIR